MFSCESFPGDAKSRLRNALDVECFGATHMQWVITLGLPYFLIVIVGLPLVALRTLARNKDGLDSPDVLEKYGFLYMAKAVLLLCKFV